MEETYSKLNSTQKIVVKLFSATGYRVYGWYWLHSLVHLLQQLVLAAQPCTLTSTTRYRVYPLVLGTQPCTLVSTTGYRVYWSVLPTQPSSTTAYRVYRLVLATQPCTLASTTGYRVYRLVLATQPSSTTTSRVYRLVLATQLCTLASTAGYRVCRLVLATQPCALASTYRLQSILTGCWLPSLPVFCRLQRITGYSKVLDMESWYRTELPKVNLVTENS